MLRQKLPCTISTSFVIQSFSFFSAFGTDLRAKLFGAIICHVIWCNVIYHVKAWAKSSAENRCICRCLVKLIWSRYIMTSVVLKIINPLNKKTHTCTYTIYTHRVQRPANLFFITGPVACTLALCCLVSQVYMTERYTFYVLFISFSE